MALNLVPFVSVDKMMKLVLHLGIERVMRDLVAEIEADFRRWPLFDKTPRIASHSDVGVIELMPTSDGETYGFKYVNGHPSNMKKGLQTVTAFGLLADVSTGYPVLLSEMTILTALRTAATSAMAAKWLGPKTEVMALIGNGAQAEFQALAMRDALGITALRLFDTDPAATARLQANLAGEGFAFQRCASAADALRGADVVTTATAAKTRAAVVGAEMLRPGMHLNAIGGDCPGKTELTAEVLRGARVFVEYEPQSRIEGELQQMGADFPATEFWQVLAGQAPGRQSDDEITVFDSVGFALEDHAALVWLQAAAARLGLGRPLDLVAAPADPKNLFAGLQASAGALHPA